MVIMKACLGGILLALIVLVVFFSYAGLPMRYAL